MSIFLVSIMVLPGLLAPVAWAREATPPPAPEAGLLDKLLGDFTFNPAPDAKGLLLAAARTLNLQVQDANFTPALDPAHPLEAAIHQWVAATGSTVATSELQRQVDRADTLPIDLQRALATVILATLEAMRLQELALAGLTAEERDFVAANRDALATAPESAEGQRMQTLATKVDLAKSVEATLVLLNALETQKPVIASWSQRLAEGNDAQLVAEVLQPYLPLLANEADTQARFSLAQELIARASGSTAPLRPYTRAMDTFHPLAAALANLVLAMGLPLDDQTRREILQADTLPIDLQRAIALIVYAKTDALLAQVAGSIPGVSARESAALAAKGQLDLMSAIAQSAPALEMWGLVLAQSPSLHRLALQQGPLRAALAIQQTKAFTQRDLTPADALGAALAIRGLDVGEAPQVLARSAADSLRSIYEANGFTLTDAEAAGVNAAVADLDAPVRESLVQLLAAVAFADGETRAALAPLTLAERERLQAEASYVDALLAETRALSADERALVTDHLRLAQKGDFPRIARASLALLDAVEASRDRLAPFVPGASAPASSTSSTPGFLSVLSVLSPIGTARAQGDVPRLACPNNAFSRCGSDVFFEDPRGLVAVTGSGGSTYIGRHVLSIDLGGSDSYFDNAGGANGGAALTPVSVVLDMGGRDTYANGSRITQGAASFGIGILVDAGIEGDVFTSLTQAQGFGYFGVGMLVNEAGDDDYGSFMDSQGRGSGVTAPGIGLLLDRAGNDVYRGTGSQGYGFGGVLVDAGGQDVYGPQATTLGIPVGAPGSFAERTDNSLWLNGPAAGAGDVGVGIDFDPIQRDADSDQWPDLAERLAGSDPANATDTPEKGVQRTVSARLVDSDSDGVIDDAERYTGTDPHDPDDYFLGIPVVPHWPVDTPIPLLTDAMGMAPQQFVQQWNSRADEAGEQAKRSNLTYGRGFILNVGMPDLPAQEGNTVLSGPLALDLNNPDSFFQGNRTLTADAAPSNWSANRGPCTTAGIESKQNLSDPKTPTSGSSAQWCANVRLFALGDTVPTTYHADYLLSIDLGGDDLYRNAPGSAVVANMRFNLALAQGASIPGTSFSPKVDFTIPPTDRILWIPTAALDLSGDDRYEPVLVVGNDGAPTPLSAHGSRGGILVDMKGNDTYTGGPASQGALGGILLDMGGNDRYDGRDDSQGSGGFLFDLGASRDVYVAGNRSQGYGGTHESFPQTRGKHASYGLLLDTSGHDEYDSVARMGEHTQGVAATQSVGILLDTDGTDTYRAWGRSSQGAIAGAVLVDYATIQTEVTSEDVSLQNPLASNPNPRRLHLGPALGGLIDLEGKDRYLQHVPTPSGGVLALEDPARNNRLDVQRTNATYRAPTNDPNAPRRPDLVAWWNVALRADASSEDDLNGATGITSWNGADPTDTEEDALRGFWVNLPLAGLAIGAPEATRYVKPYLLTLDLGGDDQYLNNAAGPLLAPLAGAANGQHPNRTQQDPVTAPLYPVTAALDFGGSDTYQAQGPFAFGAGIMSVALLVDDGGANAFLGALDVPALGARPIAGNVPLSGGLDPADWPAGVPLTLRSADGLQTRTVEVRAVHDGRNVTFAVLVPDATPTSGTGGDGIRVLLDGNHDHALGDGDDGVAFGATLQDLHFKNGQWVSDDLTAQHVAGDRVQEPDLACAGATTPGCWIYRFTKPLASLDAQDLRLAAGGTLAFGIEVQDTAAGAATLYPAGGPGAWATLTLLADPADSVAPHVHPLSHTMGVGIGGVGLLLASGPSRANDRYLAGSRSLGYAGENGVGIVLDVGGSDTYRSGARSQGSGARQGVGVLLDLSGNDVYVADRHSQGYMPVASTDGTGFFLDVSGDDYYKYEGPKRKLHPQNGPTPRSHNGWVWTQIPASSPSSQITTGLGLDLDQVDQALTTLGVVSTNRPDCNAFPFSDIPLLPGTAFEQHVNLSKVIRSFDSTPGLEPVGGEVCTTNGAKRDLRTTRATVETRRALPGGGCDTAPLAAKDAASGEVCLLARPTILGQVVERVDFILRLKSRAFEPGIPLGSGQLVNGAYTLRWNSSRAVDDLIPDGTYVIIPRVYLSVDAHHATNALSLSEREAWTVGAYYEDGVPFTLRLDNAPLLANLRLEPGAFSRHAPGTGAARFAFDLGKDLPEDIATGGGLLPAGAATPCAPGSLLLCDTFPLYFAATDVEGDLRARQQGELTRPAPVPAQPSVRTPPVDLSILTAYNVCLPLGGQHVAGLVPPTPGSSGGLTDLFTGFPSAPGAKPTTLGFVRNATQAVFDPAKYQKDLQNEVAYYSGAYPGEWVNYALGPLSTWVNQKTGLTGYDQRLLVYIANTGGNVSAMSQCLLSRDVEPVLNYMGSIRNQYPPPYVANYTGTLSSLPPTSGAPTVFVMEHNSHASFTTTQRLTGPLTLAPGEGGNAPVSLQLYRNPLYTGNHTTEVTLYEVRNGRETAIARETATYHWNRTLPPRPLQAPLAALPPAVRSVPGYETTCASLHSLGLGSITSPTAPNGAKVTKRCSTFENENPFRAANPFYGSTTGALNLNKDATVGEGVYRLLLSLSGNTAPMLPPTYKEAWKATDGAFAEGDKRVNDDISIAPDYEDTSTYEKWSVFREFAYLDGRTGHTFEAGSTLRMKVRVVPEDPTHVEELWIGAGGYESRVELKAVRPTVAANEVSAELRARDGSGIAYPLILHNGTGTGTSVRVPGGAFGPGLETLSWNGYYRNPYTGREAAMPDGDYILTLRAKDARGSVSMARAFVTVDNEAPVTTATLRPHSGLDATSGNALTVTWKGDDHDGSGIAYYRLRVSRDGATWKNIRADGTLADITPTDATDPALRLTASSVKIALDTVAGRAYHFLVIAVDRAGNIESGGLRSAASEEAAFAEKRVAGMASTHIDQARPRLHETPRLRDATGSILRLAGPHTPGIVKVCAEDPSPGSGIDSVSLKAFKEVAGAAPLVNTHTLRSIGGGCFAFETWHRALGDRALYPSGTWSYYVSVVDRAGNEARSDEMRLVVDNLPPQMLARVHYPEGQAAAKAGDEIRVQVRTTDATSIRALTLDASALNLTPSAVRLKTIATPEGPMEEAVVAIDRANLTNGLHVLTLTAVDEVGNVATVTVKVLLADARPPAPEAPGIVQLDHESVTLQWRTLDESATLVRYGLSRDRLDQTFEGTTFGTLHEARLTGLLPSRTYHYRVDAKSIAGIVTPGDTVHTFNTTSALSLELVTPGPTKPGGRDLAIVWKGSHPQAVPVRYEVAIGVPGAFRIPLGTLTEAGMNHTYRLDASLLADRTDYVITLRAQVGADTVELTSPPFTVDATAPHLYGQSPTVATRDARPTLRLHAADALTGLAAEGITVDVDGKRLAVPANLSGDEITIPLDSDLTEGFHDVRVTVRDRAGNPAVLEWRFAVDRTAPILAHADVTYTPGPERANRGSRGHVNLTVEDAGGVSAVALSVPGVPDPVPLRLGANDRWTGTFLVPLDAPERAQNLTFAATDHAGNVRFLTAALVVDSTPPVIVKPVRTRDIGFQQATLLVTTNEPTLVTAVATRGTDAPIYVAGTGYGTLASLDLTGLLPSATYRVDLTARDLAGNVARATLNVTTQRDDVKPTEVAGLEVRDLGNGQLALSWDAASDDVGLAGYRVYRATGDGAFIPLITQPDTGYLDTTVGLGRVHRYKVVAVDLAGNEGPAGAELTGSSSAIPVLRGGSVTPDIGTKADTYTYRVTYVNAGGVAPEEVRVIIDGVAYPMTRETENPDYTQGVTYVYRTNLPPHTLGSPHTYRFEATDGRYLIAFGASPLLKGPLVSDVDAPQDEGGLLSGIGAAVRGIPSPGALFTLMALALASAFGLAARRRRSQ